MTIGMELIGPAERGAFLDMAETHFRELDPGFVPQASWKRDYFDKIQANPRYYLRWIVADGKRAGFILFGLEGHRFLAKTSGWIYELYVRPEFRLQGIARSAGEQAMEELQKHTDRLQLEIMEGNKGAAALWKSLGFGKFCERWVRTGGPK